MSETEKLAGRINWAIDEAVLLFIWGIGLLAGWILGALVAGIIILAQAFLLPTQAWISAGAVILYLIFAIGWFALCAAILKEPTDTCKNNKT